MSIDLNQFHQVFFDEVKEHLAEMERLLLVLDLACPDAEDLNAIFRAAHSIKGGASTFGFDDMTAVTHALESMLDRVRHGELTLTSDMVDASLQAGDVISEQLRGHRDATEVSNENAQPVIELLKSLSQNSPSLNVVVHEGEGIGVQPGSLIHVSGGKSLRIYVKADGVSPGQCDSLLAELRRSGPADQVQVTDPSSVVFDCAISQGMAEEILSFILAPEMYRCEPLNPLGDQSVVDEGAKDEIALEGEGFGFFIHPDKVRAQIENEQGFGFFVDLPLAHAPSLPSEPRSSGVPTGPGNTPATADALSRTHGPEREPDSSIRVNIGKVDQLINLVGELVITNAMLAQTVSDLDPVTHEKVFSAVAQLEHNSRDLQESVMSIRMLPIGSIFSRFPRMVREITAKLGKEADLKMVGEATELDKGLIERLADPLTHLVRNSVDHGIEDPALREAAGKPRKGRLTLQAFHRGGNIVIEVIDDGAGLNRERILAKAAASNIVIAADAPDHEVWQLIFAPGFSTAEKVTDVSGRGVGMDVVKRNIEGMGGRVELSSQTGIGTRITIRLPLTLAILDGMSIGVGSQTFIVPINMILESLQPQPDDVTTVAGKGQVVHVRGDYLPLVALYDVFHIEPRTTNPCEGILVILEVDGGKVALFVDELLGQHQVVIKSLESNYRKVPGVSGATIMGDGRVGLILDVPGLIQLSRNCTFA
jgi:two-component system, chemotaxis family, sensor kinase CheA